MTLVLVMLLGGVAGAGALLLVTRLVSMPPTGAVALAELDATLAKERREASLVADRRHAGESQRMRRFGADFADAMDARGINLPRGLSASLGLAGMSREMFLARTVIGALLGFAIPGLVLAPLLWLVGLGSFTPVWLAVVGAAIGGLIPYSQVKKAADERRRGFRHVVGAFLDLVAMNLAGGRGVPEALQAASNISDGWALVRIRDTLEAARLQGSTPWAALGRLGDEVDIDELRDLAAALALVAEDGAKVRESLSARASSMRRRELADLEGQAGARSQSMLVAQLLLCLGFLLFLIYPAIARILA